MRPSTLRDIAGALQVFLGNYVQGGILLSVSSVKGLAVMVITQNFIT